MIGSYQGSLWRVWIDKWDSKGLYMECKELFDREFPKMEAATYI